MRTFLEDHICFSNSEYDELLSIASLKHFAKGETLLSQGRKVDKMFFIESGFVRGYRIADGRDLTHHFFVANRFGTDYESYLTGSKGDLILEAIIDSSVYEFKKSALEALYQKIPAFEKIRIIIGESAYLQIVDRLKDFQRKDLKDRYLKLIERNPELFNLVPQIHIASYLGVAPQSLSRIKEAIKAYD